MPKHLTLIMTFCLLNVAALFSPICAETDVIGQAYLQGDYAAVIEGLENKFSTGRTNIQERIILARSYLHLQHLENAERVLKSVLNDDGENPEANTMLGKTLLEKQRFDEALPVLYNALKRTNDPAVKSLLGQCYYYSGDTHQAAKFLKEAFERETGNSINGLLLGHIYLQRGYGLRAEQYLLKALSDGRHGIDIERALGNAYLLQRKYTGPVVKRHIPNEMTPGDLLADGVILQRLEEEKHVYLVASRYSSIFQGYRTLNLNAADLEALYMVCQGWLSFGDTQRAAEFLESIKQQDPSSKRSMLLEAQILLASHDFKALERHLTHTAQRQMFTHKEIAEWYYDMALASRAKGEKKQAVTYLQQGEALHSTSEKVIRALAELHNSLGNIAESRQYYSKYLELFPDAADVDDVKNILSKL